MRSPSTRRAFLANGIGLLVGGAAALTLRPAATLAAPAVESQDLVDVGEAFTRGTARGVSVVGEQLRATGTEGVFTSAPLRAPSAFTHVGLHWAAAVPPNASLTFELRTSADGAAWSDWRPLHVERLPEETPVGEYFASLIAARGGGLVQYRATLRTAGGASPSVQRVTATLIDSPEGVASLPTVEISDAASGRRLALTAREGWTGSAGESYRFDRRGREIWPEMFVPTKKLVVHHTATGNGYADGAAEARAIYRYHAVTQRWGDIGYSALIDKHGTIYEGRHGRGGDLSDTRAREVLSAGVVAGHDYAHNYGSAGVALLGDATAADWQMTSAMWDALVRYSVFEAGRSFLRPLSPDGSIAVSDFLRSDDAWSSGMRNVSGHRETNSTACPGEPVMALLGALSAAIQAGLADTSRTGVAVTGQSPAARETVVGTPISYTWAAEAPQDGWRVIGHETCWEGWSKSSNSDDIEYLTGYDATEARRQPVPVWSPASGTTASLTPQAAGHYTFHVRAVLDKTLADGTVVRRPSAYEANHTFLVKSASTKPRR